MSKKNPRPETGHHEPRIHTESPTVREKHAQRGELVCSRCSAEYSAKHWYPAGKLQLDVVPRITLCPGCHKVEENIWNGELYLEGDLLHSQNEEMENLISNVTAECFADNPLAKIVTVTRKPGQLQLTTTTEWLAERIGKAVSNAFGGELKLQRSPEKEQIKVYWKQA